MMKPGVLLREEALRDDDEEITGRHQCRDEHGKGRPVVAERNIQALAVAGEEKVEAPLRQRIEAAVPDLLLAAHEARAHHRRQGQRDQHRDEDRHRHGDPELAEQPADDPAHQE